MPNKTGSFHLYSDTSKYVTGSALYQIQGGKPKLIAYASKRLPEAQKNYSITELELHGLAINIGIKTIAPYNHQSLQAEHGIKFLTCILTKHLTGLGQMWTKYLSLVALAYNTFNSPNLGNYSPFELKFGRKPKLLLHTETNLDIRVSTNFKEYYELLNKRIKYLQDLLFNFKSQRLAMINLNLENFQYNGGDLVYIISPLTSQLRTNLK